MTKPLYIFSVDREIEKPVSTVSVDADGQETTTTKKVKSTETVSFCIRKPVRAELNESNFFYNRMVSFGWK
jgi:hypothetical protein